MNVARFFEHWGLSENPFAAEEARHDAVFARLDPGAATHPDFEKVLGDLSRPASSIVFGEKGSGKTALRLQIEQRVEAFNADHPDRRVLLIPYDDLNPWLDRFVERLRAAGAANIDEALGRLRLADHLDAVLALATTRLVGEALAPGAEGRARARALRAAPPETRAGFALLQAVYDDPDRAPARTARLGRRIGAPRDHAGQVWTVLAALGWVPAVALAGWLAWIGRSFPHDDWTLGVGSLAAAWALALLKRGAWDVWRLRRLGGRVARRLRVIGREPVSLARSLARLPRQTRAHAPTTAGEQPRYDMMGRLRNSASALGYGAVLIVVDRIDEPTVVSGDPDRMRRVVWPMLSSTFLQMDGVGTKLLLPIELRHSLFRESSAFFQEARLDKQNLIEQFSWTGATLYDLCSARLRACRAPGAEPITLADLFAENVARQDVVDALDQMRQPRDAFKLLYQCVQEHCATVTEDQAQADGVWRVPRLILDTVRRQQADRVIQLSRGMRPA